MAAPKGNKFAVGNPGGGAKTSYRPEFANVARKLCAMGMTDRELAQLFGKSERTIRAWRAKHEDFAAATKLGKDAADDRVEASLYHRAIGYSYDAEKVFHNAGKITRVPYVEHVPPSEPAQVFWLKNRRPEVWRDRKDTEISGVVNITEVRWVIAGERGEEVVRSVEAPAQALPEPPWAQQVVDVESDVGPED